MLDEGSGAMEKKSIVRQSPVQSKNGGVTVERKSDFAPNKHGRRRQPVSSGGNKSQETVQAPRPNQFNKFDRSFSDKRSRQRNCYDSGQREEVVESGDVFDVLSTGSRKGNANHLLNIKFYPRQSQLGDHRWHNRSHFNSYNHTGYRKTKRYKKEQFLQASCQFVVRDTGDYTEQAINSDALVDWDLVELVRSFSTETVNCPICLQIPSAGKITKCGHTYCWACILHYLKLGQEENVRKCPICYDTIDIKDLKSVQWIDVPSFNVGDEIEMKLMRKAKGSVIALPKYQWEDKMGKPMNVQEGINTKFMKLLVASYDQIRREVIERELAELTVQLVDADESEACFIQMALESLEIKAKSLKLVFQQSTPKKDKLTVPQLQSAEASEEKETDRSDNQKELACPIYEDAFEDLITLDNDDKNIDMSILEEERMISEPLPTGQKSEQHRNNSQCSLPFGSPPCPFPPLPDQEVNSVPLSLEETSDQLELPVNIAQSKKTHSLNTKDTYFFYQASTGQHIYLNSLNAQCLAKEYGSLENSLDTIKATIVAIERIFMTEDVRKRLRYLDHIPLTCEIHVVELKIKPPTVNKETLKFFEAAFEKKRKMRRQKEREEKRRAKSYEIEHKKAFGIYPEVQIPLDNLNQFPSYNLEEDDGDDSFTIANLPSSICHQGIEASTHSQRSRNDSTTSDDSLSSSMSFAQMLKAGKTPPVSKGVWGRVCPPLSPSSSANPPRTRQRDEEDSDGEGLPAPNYCDSMSDAIAKALEGINLKQQAVKTVTQSASGRKKRKEKKILFSTAMSRKS